MAQLTLNHVSKRYSHEVLAVDDLNLHVEDGEFIALLGPSGCGKSTTLRMIVGLESITEGQIEIGDKVVNSLEPSQRNVALAFESYALYPPLDVFNNIAFNLKASRTPSHEIKKRVLDVARMLDISDILAKKPGELGGGQKQRVSLARALVRNPDIFLMDEPLSHLDAAQRAHMRVELKRLHAEQRRTTVLVTHDQLEAVAMAERIAVMNLGVLQQVGSFDDVYNRPTNSFVAGFIGEPPMNFLIGTLKHTDQTLHLIDPAGHFDLTLPPQLTTALKDYRGDTVQLGIRPIDLKAYPSSDPSASDTTFEATVHTFEALGEEGQLALTLGKHTLLAITPPHQHFTSGQRVMLKPTPSRMHLFDPQSGLALR